MKFESGDNWLENTDSPLIYLGLGPTASGGGYFAGGMYRSALTIQSVVVSETKIRLVVMDLKKKEIVFNISLKSSEGRPYGLKNALKKALNKWVGRF